jgi:hypothetical protein
LVRNSRIGYAIVFEKFGHRNVVSRTNKALDAIGRIGNLSNRSLYEWDEAEVRKVVKALKDAVSEVEARFASPKGKSNAKFKL